MSEKPIPSYNKLFHPIYYTCIISTAVSSLAIALSLTLVSLKALCLNHSTKDLGKEPTVHQAPYALKTYLGNPYPNPIK